METKDYTTMVPFTPPEGLLDWTMEHAEEMTRNILVYKADWARDAMTGERYRTAKLWCSACEETTYGVYVGGECCHNGLSYAPFGFLRDWEDSGKAPEVLYSGKETVCPHCGAKVRAQHCGGFRSEYCLGEAWPMTVDRVEDKLVLTGWSVYRSVRACTVPKPGAARREYQTCVEIRPYEAYGADQMTLTGAAVKSQAFADLSYTQALALLALPSEEAREEFVETHDLASMSTRELQEELRRRGDGGAHCEPLQEADEPTREELAGRLDDALNEIRDQGIELQSMKDKVRAAIEDRDKAEAGEDQEFQRANALKIERDKMQDQLISAQKERDTAQASARKAADELEKAKAALEAAKRSETDTLKKLNEAVKNPKVPKDVLDKLRKEAEEAAEKRHKADYEDLDKARAKLIKAEEEAARARQEAERLEKELKLAAPGVAEFKVLFSQSQEILNKCIEAVLELPPDKVQGGVNAIKRMLEATAERLAASRWEATPE